MLKNILWTFFKPDLLHIAWWGVVAASFVADHYRLKKPDKTQKEEKDNE